MSELNRRLVAALGYKPWIARPFERAPWGLAPQAGAIDNKIAEAAAVSVVRDAICELGWAVSRDVELRPFARLNEVANRIEFHGWPDGLIEEIDTRLERQRRDG